MRIVGGAPVADGQLEIALVDVDRLLRERDCPRLDRDAEGYELVGQGLAGGRPVGELGREAELVRGILAGRSLPGVAVLGPAGFLEQGRGLVGIRSVLVQAVDGGLVMM